MSIRLEHVNYVYSPGTAYEIHALKDICLELHEGEFIGLIGHPLLSRVRSDAGPA